MSSFSKEYLNEKIDELELQLKKYRELREEFDSIKIAEVAIRKSDNVLVTLQPKFTNVPAIAIDVQEPMGTRTITLGTYYSDYIEYSKKTRHLFPKKWNKRG